MSYQGNETQKGRKRIQIGCIHERVIGIGIWGTLRLWTSGKLLEPLSGLWQLRTRKLEQVYPSVPTYRGSLAVLGSTNALAAHGAGRASSQSEWPLGSPRCLYQKALRVKGHQKCRGGTGGPYPRVGICGSGISVAFLRLTWPSLMNTTENDSGITTLVG